MWSRVPVRDTGIASDLDLAMIMMVHSANFFNYINLAQADNSGMLRFLTDELQDAEDKGDRGVLVPCDLTMHLLTLFFSLDHRTCSIWLGWE